MSILLPVYPQSPLRPAEAFFTPLSFKRVAALSEAIAKEMKIDKETIANIRTAALIHDIGKITIPASILSKPGKLSEIEISLIQQHTKIGAETVKEINFGYPISNIILPHHEREDGSGYPNALKGENIMLEAKIIAVADVVEAMSSHRPYRPSFGIEKALKEIKDNKGIKYDSKVVNACIFLFEKKDYKL